MLYLENVMKDSATAITQSGFQTNNKDFYWKQTTTQEIAHRRPHRFVLNLWAFSSRSQVTLYPSFSTPVFPMEIPAVKQFYQHGDSTLVKLTKCLSKIRIIEESRSPLVSTLLILVKKTKTFFSYFFTSFVPSTYNEWSPESTLRMWNLVLCCCV